MTFFELAFQNVNQALEAPITNSEITEALEKCKNNKAPGTDGLLYAFLKNLPKNWFLHISFPFNKVSEQAKIPDSWANIHLKMFFKKGDRQDLVTTIL